MPMFSILSNSRAAVGFFLFLSLILTVFLLSGVTQPTPAIRNIYLIKLHYTSPNITDSDTPDTLVPVIPLMPKITNPNSNAGRPTPTSTTPKPTFISFPKQTFVAASPTLRQRTQHAIPAQGINPFGHKRSEILNHNDRPLDNRRQSLARQPLSDEQTLREIISLKDVELDVFFGYYGFCVGGKTIPVRCTNKRPKSAQALKVSLFPGEYNQDGSVNTTSLTLEKDPQDILYLGLQMQRAISPVPVIGAVIAFGIAWLISVWISYTSGSSYAGVGGAENVRLDKITFGLAMLGLLLLLMAVSFLKVAGDVAYEILTGQQGGNTTGFLLEVAGVDATPGYNALRIGIAALVMVAGVVGGMAWCMGIGRRVERKTGGLHYGSGRFGMVGGLLGRFMGRGGEQTNDGPEWKRSIGKPIPVFGHQMQGYPVHPQQHMHPAFAAANYV
ncbi:hypothetical protein BGX38DRAFT_823393 [Terfezia claveryi]|nr:hypothetical protein BGX38DRAFT_823393 [Terfezia claveryi]